MNQLETLLNTLIKMGWKPFGMEIHAEYIDRIVIEGPTMHIIFRGDGEYIEGLRTLVSQESGLWQFCEKNGLLHEYYNGRSNIHPYKCYWTTTYEYRLLESALVPEEELGKFLVDNIIVEGKKE